MNVVKQTAKSKDEALNLVLAKLNANHQVKVIELSEERCNES